MTENDMTGEGLLDLLNTPAPLWLVIGAVVHRAVASGEGWSLVYDLGRQPMWQGAIVTRPMAGRYADRNGTDVIVVADDGSWASETIR